jgi:hypothetical protein
MGCVCSAGGGRPASLCLKHSNFRTTSGCLERVCVIGQQQGIIMELNVKSVVERNVDLALCE